MARPNTAPSSRAAWVCQVSQNSVSVPQNIAVVATAHQRIEREALAVGLKPPRPVIEDPALVEHVLDHQAGHRACAQGQRIGEH